MFLKNKYLISSSIESENITKLIFSRIDNLNSIIIIRLIIVFLWYKKCFDIFREVCSVQKSTETIIKNKISL